MSSGCIRTSGPSIPLNLSITNLGYSTVRLLDSVFGLLVTIPPLLERTTDLLTVIVFPEISLSVSAHISPRRSVPKADSRTAFSISVPWIDSKSFFMSASDGTYKSFLCFSGSFVLRLREGSNVLKTAERNPCAFETVLAEWLRE